MPDEKCDNQNHSKMNVAVRFCPNCGIVVNSSIPHRKCNREYHVKSRKEGSHFCSDCGANLKASY